MFTFDLERFNLKIKQKKYAMGKLNCCWGLKLKKEVLAIIWLRKFLKAFWFL